MAYLVTLHHDELHGIEANLAITQRFTKALPPGVPLDDFGPQLALLISRNASDRTTSEPSERHIAWMGVVRRTNTVGPVDKSITIEPLRKCLDVVHIDGPQGLLPDLPDPHRSQLEKILASGDVSRCAWATWRALAQVIREKHTRTSQLLDWLAAQANPAQLSNEDEADRSWQEQGDALRTALRITDFPLSTFAAWRRPPSYDAPYLAGLIPEPVEHSMIEHDARESTAEGGLFETWRQRIDFRCDIHVMRDSNGRRLEVANVNATPVEHRLGTDLIYYHEPTHSFVMVQYKRVSDKRQRLTVDKRLLSQMSRLEAVAQLSTAPSQPHDWRLGQDPCFLKLAYWPDNHKFAQELAPGMYLPVSYARLLLAHDGTKGRGKSRILSADTVDRYLVSTQFIDLVKHGLVGTVGTSVEQLRDFGTERAEQGYSVVVAAEAGRETARQRQNRVNRRGSLKNKTRVSHDNTQQSLFDTQPSD